MNIDSITNGIVIDHIPAGRSMRIYQLLGLDKLDCPVAIIKNAVSAQMGKKDIIKVDNDIDVNLDIIGFVAPNATVNIIRDGQLIEKKHMALPEKLVNVLHCKNPRCITSVEQELEHIFIRSDESKTEYRCLYCETKANIK